MPPKPPFSLGVVILAAGKSSRMGRPKMLLPWNRTTVLGHLLTMWAQIPASQIAVVRARGDAAIQTELRQLGFPLENCVINPQPDRGMFSSVQCGARWSGWKSTLTHFAITLGDQPQLQFSTLQALTEIAKHRRDKICQPSYDGHPKHPVIVSKSEFNRLARSRAQTLKNFLRARADKISLIEMDDAGLDFDLDYPADYEDAVKRFGLID